MALTVVQRRCADGSEAAALLEDEAAVIAFRRHTLLPLDDCLYALQPSLPHLTRSSLHRCLQRHGISRLPDVEDDKPKRSKFKAYPIGSCLVAARRWDAARWAIKAYAWRFDGLRCRVARRAR